MGILATLLQGLSGIVGGLNGNVGLQIIGSATIDAGSTTPASVAYTPPVGNNGQIVVVGAALRMPNGTPAPTTSGYPLQVSVRFNGVQGFILPVDSSTNLPAVQPKYAWGEPTSTIPLGTNTVITAQMVVPSATSTTTIIDVVGYAVSLT